MALERLIVIDGYNLILRSPHLKPGPSRTLRESREKLVNLLSWAVGPGDSRFVVVFDGANDVSHDEPSGRVAVRYARPPAKADDLIRDLVEDQIERVERLTVVTSDLEVARHARAMGADIAISDLFLASLLPSQAESEDQSEKPTTLTRKELEEWAELFSRRKSAPKDDEPE
ncbi:MAG TPA: NYN domain-containing protein [Candidatus Limnocylindria bacterium]|nr:NYN domain-containing protein [Candidatus Limnocylindria bacterium]